MKSKAMTRSWVLGFVLCVAGVACSDGQPY